MVPAGCEQLPQPGLEQLILTSVDEVQKKDIVFCQAQPKNRFFAHLVKYKWWEDGQWHFQISNLAGRPNGWCRIEHIYGLLVRCQH